MVHHNELLGYMHMLQQPDLLFRLLIPPDLGISFGAFQFSPGISQLFLLGINLYKGEKKIGVRRNEKASELIKRFFTSLLVQHTNVLTESS